MHQTVWWKPKTSSGAADYSLENLLEGRFIHYKTKFSPSSFLVNSTAVDSVKMSVKLPNCLHLHLMASVVSLLSKRSVCFM